MKCLVWRYTVSSRDNMQWATVKKENILDIKKSRCYIQIKGIVWTEKVKDLFAET